MSYRLKPSQPLITALRLMLLSSHFASPFAFADSIAGAPLVVDDPVSIKVGDAAGDQNEIEAYRSYSSCTTWYWLPSQFVPLINTQVFNQLTPYFLRSRPDSTVNQMGLASEHSFYVKADMPTDAQETELKKAIAKEVNKRALQKTLFYENCQTNNADSDILLEVIPAGWVTGSGKPGGGTPEDATHSASPERSTGFYTVIDSLVGAAGGRVFNPTAPLGVTLVADAFDPRVEPQLSEDLNSGLATLPHFERPPVLSIAMNMVTPVVSGKLTLSGEISAEFYSKLEEKLRCTTKTSSSHEHGGAVDVIAGGLIAGPVGALMGGLFGGSDSVDTVTECAAPEWLTGIKGCDSADSAKCNPMVDQLQIHFDIRKLGGKDTITACMDSECKHMVSMKYTELARWMLLDQWFSSIYQQAYDAMRGEVFLKEKGRNGKITGRIDRTFSLDQSETFIASHTVPILASGLKNKIPAQFSLDLSRDPAVRCMRGLVSSTWKLFNPPIAGFYHFDEAKCSDQPGSLL